MSASQSEIFKALCTLLFLLQAAIETSQKGHCARPASRIVDGVNVTPANKYPMIVSLQKNGENLCSGTILSKYYVLTSASCVLYIGPTAHVVAGIYQLGDPDYRYVQNYSIDNTTLHIRHKDPKKGFISNDIALIKVTSPFVWNDHVAPTNLPSPCWTVLPNEEIKVKIVGWGLGRNRTYPHAPIRPLQEVELPLLTTEDCQRARRNSLFSDDQVCVDAAKGAGPCQKDWGGPLFFYNEAADTYIQGGISVWVDPECGNLTNTGPDGPPFWTKVSRFFHWIENAARACDPTRPIKRPKHTE